MTSINRVAALAALTFTVGIGALTGCSSQHHANVGQATGVQANNTTSNETSNKSQSGSNNVTANSTNNTSSDATGRSGSKFPHLVTQAVQSLPNNIVSSTMAPTVLPMPQSGDALSYKATQSTTPSKSQPAYQSAYDVVLQTTKGHVGGWSIWNFASASDASKAVATITGPQQPQTKGVATVVLSKNQNAQVYQDANGGTTIYWAEKGWNINVTEAKSEVAPTPIADDITNYLASNQISNGGGNAMIDITTTDGTNNTVDARLTWPSGKTVVSVNVTGLSVKPVETALAMMGSMQPYSGSGQ